MQNIANYNLLITYIAQIDAIYNLSNLKLLLVNRKKHLH